jgi:hypothetical protein
MLCVTFVCVWGEGDLFVDNAIILLVVERLDDKTCH